MINTLCFKPTRNVHESGFRYIEYGYYDNDTDKVEVVSRYDVIELPNAYIDLTKSGWFRILDYNDSKYEWAYGGKIIAKPYPVEEL